MISGTRMRLTADRARSGLTIVSILLVTLLLLLAACEAPDGDPADPVAGDPVNGEGVGEDDSADAPDTEPDDEDTIQIGLLGSLEGALSDLGIDGYRGAKIALNEFGGELQGTDPMDPVFGATVAGRPVEFVYEASDASPDVAVAAMRRLVEGHGVRLAIGPSSGSEGLAIVEYAKDVPDVTFVNGTHGAVESTLLDPAPNFFRFDGDGVQDVRGLGTYVYEELGIQRVATVGEDYAFPYAQIGGFTLEFCEAGGEIVDRQWPPLDTTDWASYAIDTPQDVDAVFVAMSGSNAIDYIREYDAFLGDEIPILGGSSVLETAVLQELGSRMVGVVGAAGIAHDAEFDEWQEWMERYRELFPDAPRYPSAVVYNYYINTRALLEGLEEVGGDLSDDGERLREVLAERDVEGPLGTVSPNHNLQAEGPNFVQQVAEEDGDLFTETVMMVESVSQTMGLDEDEYIEVAPWERDFECP
jgi:branched-chain amino acid transport system substrate-binding protein